MKVQIAACALLAGIGLASSAQADTANLFQCTNRGFILQKCELQKVELAKPGLDEGAAFDTDYAVTYDFPCVGNVTNLAVRSGQDVQYLRMGSRGETVNVRGNGPLETYDPSPEMTRRLGYRPGCSLVVRSVTVLPATSTLALWSSEAKSQARILSMARDLYVLSKSFASLASFDRAQLGVVIEATQARYDAASSAIDRRRWKSLLDSLVAMRDAQPLPVPKAEVDAYLADLAADARASLLEESDRARAMITRFETWSLEVEKTLADVLDTIPVT
ncbi:CHAD domain-containing protein [bacterium]|nr:MAG: CHAD domain-containing protein [bacterium]